jgi:ribosomal protein S27AE
MTIGGGKTMKDLQRANLVRVKCPHCGAPARTRTSKTLSSLYREIYYHCMNLECGSTFMASHEIVRMITMPPVPNPDVRLPMLAGAAHRAGLKAGAPPANDDEAQPDATASG